MTTAQIAFIRSGEENRQTRRRIVNFAAVLDRVSASFENVQIMDLSERGCRASVEQSMPEGSFLMVKLPGMEAIRAQVVWSSGSEIGCSFEEQLHPAVIDQLLGKGATGQRAVVKRRGDFGLKGAE